MGLIDGLIKGALARKVRRKLGSWAPLLAGALMLFAFILQALGEVAASDALLQAYKWLGVDSPIPAQTLVQLRDAINALAPSLYAWLAPITGAGAAYKLNQKSKDRKGQLSKPAVLDSEQTAKLNRTPEGAKAAKLLERWRFWQNDAGMGPEKAFRMAHMEVYGS